MPNRFSWRNPQRPDPDDYMPSPDPGPIIELTPHPIQNRTPDHHISLPQQTYHADVGLIGPRSSGKSAYASALAAWSNQQNPENVCPIAAVNCFDADTHQISARMSNVILEGDQLRPTQLLDETNAVQNSYAVNITFKRTFADLDEPLTLDVSFQDFSGEVFNSIRELTQKNRAIVDRHLEDFKSKNGLLFFLDGTARYRDREYSVCFNQFMDLWSDANQNSCRMAIIISKCDLPELWGQRYVPDQMVQKKFPQLHQKIQTWLTQGSGLEVNYFASSAFGTTGHGKRRQSNSKTVKQQEEGTTSVIAQSQFWRPFGLISPLYWLATQQRPPRLPGEVEPW